MQRCFFLYVIFLFSFLPAKLCAQGWQWARSITGYNFFNGHTTDVIGNTYFFYLANSFQLKDTTGRDTILSKSGIVKLDPDGRYLWLAEIELNSTKFIYLKVFAGDALKENIRIIGSTPGDISIDNKTIIADGSAKRSTIFIAECDNNGKWISAKAIGDAFSWNEAQSVMDKNGNIILQLPLADSIKIGTNVIYKNNNEFGCSWIGKIDTTGNLLWNRKFTYNQDSIPNGANASAAISCFGIDKLGNLIVFGPELIKSRKWIVFYKLDPAGNLILKKEISDNIIPAKAFNNLLIDTGGNIYFTGSYNGIINDSPVRKTEDEDIFLAKYNSDFKLIWLRQLKGKYRDACTSSALDDSSNLFIIGLGTDVMDFGGIIRNVSIQDTFYSQDLFFRQNTIIAKYSPDGIAKWVYIPKPRSFSHGNWIKLDDCNNITVSGVFYGVPAEKNVIKFGNQFAISSKADGLYLARYSRRALEIKHKNYCGYDSLVANGDTANKSFKWQFSNGQILNGRKIIFIADSAGWYKVKLSATTPKGCRQHTEDSFYFALPPKAYFVLEEKKACQFNFAQFRDSSIKDTINAATGENWYWDFGDGTTATGSATPDKVYTKPGIFKVLFKYDNGFCSDTFFREIEVLAAPKPGFSVSATEGCAPMTVKITDKAEGEIVSYSYASSNGLKQTVSEPEFTFTSPGRYRITQSLEGPTGCITKDSVFINVRPGFTASDNLEILSATVTSDSTVKITFKSLAAVAYDKYILYRGSAVQGFHPSASEPVFTDRNLDCRSSSYTYKLSAGDSCGNMLGSATARTILLKGENHGNQYALLKWSAYEVWKEGVFSYCIQSKNQQGEWEELNCTASDQKKFADQQFAAEEKNKEKCYRICANEKNGNLQQSFSNELCLPFLPVVWIPDAFTPNGDELNNTFKVSGLGIATFRLDVYNRWGEKIFTSTDMENGWDGKVENTPAPPGEYLYMLKAKGFNAENIYRNGSVLLIR